MRKIFTFLLLVFVIISADAQCAMCKAVIENGNEPMAEGVNNGITYLMVFPYLLVGFLIYAIYRYRQVQKN
ncbi:MAG: hypothetical protein ACON4X_02275 [Polaribacter sp.]|jgi:hypothetical protein